MKTNLIVFLFIIIGILKTIKSDTIQFDAVITCTIKTPCDFNNEDSWLGGSLPGSDDDVVIDYSNSIAREVYIFAKGSNHTLKSLTIKGHTSSDDKSHPHLILTDCTFNISKAFSIVRSTVIFNQTSTRTTSNNIDINSKLRLVNSSAIYVYNKNIVNANSMMVDIRSKVHFYNNSLLQISGNSTFENQPVFMDHSVFITFNEKNQQHLTLFKNGLSSASGQVSLGSSQFSGGSTIINNLIVNDLVQIKNGANLTITNKFNMISSGSISIDSLDSKLIISNTTLQNQQLSNVQLSNGAQIIISNPTINVSKVSGTGDIQFDTLLGSDKMVNTISQLNSSGINIGVAGNSNLMISSCTINKLYDFESRLDQSNSNSNVAISGLVNIALFNIVYTQITVGGQVGDKLVISKLNENNGSIVDSTIKNQGEIHLINSTLSASIDSTGTTLLNNSTLNGGLFLFGTNVGGELNYTGSSTINGFLQLNDNAKTIINYNNLNDKLTINGNLIINSNYFSIVSNGDNNNNNQNSLLNINGDILCTTATNKPSISLYFTSEPALNQPYQLFKLKSTKPSPNQNQTLSSLLSSIIKPILITNTNHHNINTELNLHSQYYFDNNSIVYTKFNSPLIAKHMSGWEVFLIIFSCIAVVALVAGMVFVYSNHKRYIGYLPLN